MPKTLDRSFQRSLGDGPSSSAFNSTVGSTQVVKRKHQTPEWFANEVKVAEFIRARYPQPCRVAAKWLIVIRMWFLGHWNDTKIEENYGWKPGECGSIVQKIRRALRGDRLDGRRRTGRSRGRPKKNQL